VRLFTRRGAFVAEEVRCAWRKGWGDMAAKMGRGKVSDGGVAVAITVYVVYVVE
jgi:hypothetical protein